MSFPIRYLVLAAGLLALAGCDIRQPAPIEAPPVVAVTNTLLDVARAGDLALAQQLIAAGADVHQVDAERKTPLHLAAASGQAGLVALLAQSGADLNARDLYGFTPLHDGAREGKQSAVETLVGAGADVNVRDVNGYTAAKIAELSHRQDVADYLYAHGCEREAPPAETNVAAVAPSAEAPPPAVWMTGATFRVWTSASGAKVEAEFMQCLLDTVTLRGHDGNFIRIRINQLSPGDQALARQLAGSVQPIMARQRAEPGAKERSLKAGEDSIGARIGKGGGWDVLENCHLIHALGNDGDSFHVNHGGKEYIFRLYYVDCAETSKEYPDRVAEQARYFHLSDAETLQLGEEAKHFTDRILSAAPFTVVTKWEDARGNSQLPRQYAFVITPQGDLDELLTAEGLVRQYGMRIDDGFGGRKHDVLLNLEREAKHNRVGAWGVGRDK